MDSNPDSDHLSHMDCDPDSNPDSGPDACMCKCCYRLQKVQVKLVQIILVVGCPPFFTGRQLILLRQKLFVTCNLQAAYQSANCGVVLGEIIE